MKVYRITIRGDKWASDYSVQATNWRAAIGRAISEWQKSAGKRSRTDQLSIKAIKGGELLKSNDANGD